MGHQHTLTCIDKKGKLTCEFSASTAGNVHRGLAGTLRGLAGTLRGISGLVAPKPISKTAVTIVRFYKEWNSYDPDGVLAVFPEVPGTRTGGTMGCYSRVGQHSTCTSGYLIKLKSAKPAEYARLKAELEGAPYNYKLEVVDKLTPKIRQNYQKNLRKIGG